MKSLAAPSSAGLVEPADLELPPDEAFQKALLRAEERGLEPTPELFESIKLQHQAHQAHQAAQKSGGLFFGKVAGLSGVSDSVGGGVASTVRALGKGVSDIGEWADKNRGLTAGIAAGGAGLLLYRLLKRRYDY